MLAEANRLTEGIEEYFAIRAIAQMRADFLANFAGQLVVQIGGEAFEHFDAIPFAVPLMRGGLAGAWICAYTVCHGHTASLTIPNYRSAVATSR